MIFGVVFNEVFLEAAVLERTAFTQETRWIIRSTQGLAFVLAWTWLRSARPVESYRTASVIVLNLMVLFGLLNVVAHLALAIRDDRAYSPASYFHRPQDLLIKDSAILRRAYPGRTKEEIAELIQPPDITDHPVLPFMERPVRSRMYNVGLENMRHPEVQIDGAVWVFGGSTVFGHGVADKDTIPAQMAQLDPARAYANFGVQGYDSSLELQKLILLLKKGYRPAHVVFLDGLNDSLACLSSNFSPAETPVHSFTAYRHHHHVGTFDRHRGVRAMLWALPISRWIDEWRIDGSPQEVSATQGPVRLDDPLELYRVDPWLHYKKTPSTYEDKVRHSEHYAHKVETRLRQNLMVARGLGKAFGFKVSAYLQPFGLLSLDNPFIREPKEYQEGDVYRTLFPVVGHLRRHIANGALGMIDLSEADQDCGTCYVDLAHYNPELSKRLAQRMIAGMGGAKE